MAWWIRFTVADAEFHTHRAPSRLQVLHGDVTSCLEQQPLCSPGRELPTDASFLPPRVSRCGLRSITDAQQEESSRRSKHIILIRIFTPAHEQRSASLPFTHAGWPTLRYEHVKVTASCLPWAVRCSTCRLRAAEFESRLDYKLIPTAFVRYNISKNLLVEDYSRSIFCERPITKWKDRRWRYLKAGWISLGKKRFLRLKVVRKRWCLNPPGLRTHCEYLLRPIRSRPCDTRKSWYPQTSSGYQSEAIIRRLSQCQFNFCPLALCSLLFQMCIFLFCEWVLIWKNSNS